MQGSHLFKHCKGEARGKESHLHMGCVYLCTFVAENKSLCIAAALNVHAKLASIQTNKLINHILYQNGMYA